jgi:ubiquinone/menaquinone biosynthesis C-methylase UbiE
LNFTRSQVTPEYLRKTAQVLSGLKERTYALLRLEPGMSALDIGCGSGVDIAPMARLVCPGGRVAGLDIDPAMLAEADGAASEFEPACRVERHLGDAASLPFADVEFDAVRAERVFQNLAAGLDPGAVLAEACRVLKPGGRIVAADADWGSASADSPDADLERRLTAFFAMRLRPDGFAGRKLFGLFKRQGLSEVTVEVLPVTAAHVKDTALGGRLLEAAVRAGEATSEETSRFSEELARLSERGEFYCCVNMIIVAGTKP